MEEPEPLTLEGMIENELREKIIEKNAPNLWLNTFSLYPDEIQPYFNDKNHHIRAYAYACFVVKMSSLDRIGANYIDWLIEAGKFADLYPNENYLIPFNTVYDNVIGITIRTMTRLTRDSRRLAEVACKIKRSRIPKDPPERKDLTLTDAFGSMQMLLAGYLWKKIVSLHENMSERMIDVLLSQLEFYSKLEYDLNYISVAAIYPILEFIRYRNHMIPNKRGIPQNVKKDREYIEKLKKLDEKENHYKAEFEDIIYKLDNPEPEDERFYQPRKLRPVKVKVKKIPNFMEVIPKKLDFTRLTSLEQNPDTMRDYADHTEQIFRGKYEDQEIYCKVYNLKSYETELLDAIYKEIKCFQALSQNIDENTCFLRFYGSIFQETQIVLITEKLSQTLAQRIQILRANNKKFENPQVIQWTSSLLHSFTEMEKLGMYHGDITTENIWLDNQNKLKIINFMNTSIGPEERSSISSVAQPVGKVTIFSAPELQGKVKGDQVKYKHSKADIYSLGMVLLTMITLKDLSNYTDMVLEYKKELEDQLQAFEKLHEAQSKIIEETEENQETSIKRTEEQKKREADREELEKRILDEEDEKNPIYKVVKNLMFDQEFKKMLRKMLDVNPKKRPKFIELTNTIEPIKTRTCTTAKVNN